MSQPQNEERHRMNEQAIAEAIVRGVSAQSVAQLAYEAGLSQDEVIQLYQETNDDQ